MNGRVVHFELPFDDAERARKFYAEAFGWQVTEVPDMNYTLVTTAPSGERGPIDPGAINGGMAQRGAPISAPVLTIEVDDIDVALAEVVRLGGTAVQGRAEVGQMGWSAYFADPEGTVVGLWQTKA